MGYWLLLGFMFGLGFQPDRPGPRQPVVVVRPARATNASYAPEATPRRWVELRHNPDPAP